MYPSPFLPGSTLFIRDVAHQVVGILSNNDIQLRCADSGALWVEKIFNLLSMYTDGSLLTAKDYKPHTPRSIKADSSHHPRIEQLSLVAQTETRRKIEYVVRLERMGAFESTRSVVRSSISKVAIELNDPRPPHISTIYRWRKSYLKSSSKIQALISKCGNRGGKNQSRLNAEVESHIHEAIEFALERARTWSAEDIKLDIINRVKAANIRRPTNDLLEAPSLRTLQRRLRDVSAFDITVAKFGIKEAERRFAHIGMARRVSHILEIAEIDHSPLDVLVVNEKRQVIGRPVITVVLDRYSRCVLGYHLSLDGHGVEAVFDALRHALLPKTYLASRYADLDMEWPCFGWFTRLLMDNGAEFHAEAVGDAMINLGIISEFSKSREPNNKAFVERFLKTLNYSCIHRLPGTTLAKSHLRIGFKSEDEAALTLEELDRLIHVWICNKYHLRPQKALKNLFPLAVWQESARAFPPQLKCDSDNVEIEFSQSATSKIQHYGIDLNTHRYNSPRLTDLRKTLPRHPIVDVKWPKRDIGHIYVWDPLDREFFKVPNVNREYCGLSLSQARAVNKQRARNTPNTEAVRACASAQINDIVDTALKDKKLKHRRQGARLSGTNSARIRRPNKRPVHDALTDIEFFSETSLEIADFEIEIDGVTK